MALVRTSRGSWDSGASHGTGSYTTGSFTPSANSLLTVIVCAETNNGSSNISASLTITDSAGLTWTAITNVGNSTSWATGMRAWRAPVGASPSSMTVTVDCGANNIYEYLVDAIDSTGYDTSSPIGATATGGGSGSNGLGTDGAASITLSAAPASSSLVIGALGGDTSSTGGVTYGTGWTELYDVRGPGEAFLQVQERTGSTSTTVGWNDICTSGTAWKSLGLAFEVKAAASEVTAALTGSSSTTSSGTVGIAHDQAITGSAVTASAGTLSPLVEYSAALTGAEVTASAGTLAPVQTAALTGSAATVSAGSVASTRTVAISGSEVETAAGTLTPGSETIAELTGAEVTASVGSLAVERAVALAGSEVSAAAGTLPAVRLVAIAGSQATASAGSVAVERTTVLAGDEVSASVGTAAPGVSVALTGSSVTASAGTITPTQDGTVGLSGSEVAVSAGAVAPQTTLALAGSVVTVSAGTITAGSEVTVALTGEAVTASAGSLAGSHDLGLTGIAISGLTGSIQAVGGSDAVEPSYGGGGWLFTDWQRVKWKKKRKAPEKRKARALVAELEKERNREPEDPIHARLIAEKITQLEAELAAQFDEVAALVAEHTERQAREHKRRQRNRRAIEAFLSTI